MRFMSTTFGERHDEIHGILVGGVGFEIQKGSFTTDDGSDYAMYFSAITADGKESITGRYKALQAVTVPNGDGS